MLCVLKGTGSDPLFSQGSSERRGRKKRRRDTGRLERAIPSYLHLFVLVWFALLCFGFLAETSAEHFQIDIILSHIKTQVDAPES